MGLQQKNDADVGLSIEEALKRLREDGPNELPGSRRQSVWHLVGQVVKEPVVSLLLACGIIYLFLGDRQEALMLLAFLVVIMFITILQEHRTERTLEALRDLSSPRALVLRDGIRKRISGRDVVRGDLLLLSEGDRVAADATIVDCSLFSVDESLLTGESVPVQKRPGLDGEAASMVYAGTTVIQGHARARVSGTGQKTEIGKIGRLLGQAKREPTKLQLETRELVRVLAVVAILLCLIVVLVYATIRGSLLQGFLAGLTLAMAILPNELPAILLIFLALGAWRISRSQVLTRQMPAIELLGSITALCVDKTGTLTRNQMSVRKIACGESVHDLTDVASNAVQEILSIGVLASQKDPFDPMERAFIEAERNYVPEERRIRDKWRFIREYPLSHSLLAISRVWDVPADNDYLVATKGAPEAIADLCRIDAVTRGKISAQVREMASQGLRVLGVAMGRYPKTGSATLPDNQRDFDFRYLGLAGLADPVRPGVAESVQECASAGIRVVMITGDHPETARSIARQVGLPISSILTGTQLKALDGERLRTQVRNTSVFARTVPEQKLILVSALRECGEIVAMTGDGVNDAPALKSAHVGIAMGGRGTDVAREAASMVLLDDDFSSIVKAIGLGRRIFDNLQNVMAYLLAVHVPIAGLSIVPVLIKLPLVLLPVHVAFLHLIIEPACSIVFEAEPAGKGIMKRPPRNPKEHLFTSVAIVPGILQGLSVFATTLLVLAIVYYRGQGEPEARTMAFTTLIAANMALIFTNRSLNRTVFEVFRAPNRAFWWVLAASLVTLALVLFIPFLRALFGFSILHLPDILICFSAGALSVFWFEVIKIAGRRKRVA